ncbi:RagB/SusD family nutrient uptake outer membrane protein [Pedobacter nyackensis]|uniref:SusD family protein n=1 Tax=Pedobacter nyackensis TaxID=475255 RepID=A0A1W2DKL2_9SPHI|nr:RagB/SusD family nutrient uptake outer membrane protein [Pedobacter nyackensis]SMC97951.1 SusD family protein [Pedobacter nyackensis]
MQTKYLNTVLLAVFVLLVSSCKKFLDVKPVGKLIPAKAEELENLLNNTRTLDYHFIDNNRGSYFALLGDNFQISANQANYSYVSTHPNIDRYAAYTFYLPYENPRNPQYTWDWGIYRALGLFNNVIEGVKELPGASTSELGKTITAQAKAGRAWSMMVGTLGYGPMFDPNGQNDTRILPYRTSANPNDPNPDLSTTAQLFAFIEQDLNDALAATPNNVGNPSRANVSVVHALMAQLYMYKRDWPKMLTHAKEAWNRSVAVKGGVDNMIYNLNTFSYKPNPNASPSPGTDVEVALELQGPDLLLKQSDNRENLFFRLSPSGTGHYPSQEFLDLFDKVNDRRYKLFALKTLGYSTIVGSVKYDDGVVTKYYRDSKMLGNQGITYPELLLLKAEASARLNDLGTALADLNLLRKYRYSGASTDLVNGAALSQDNLLYEILKERRREMPIGTFQRVFDLKRYALDTGKPWSKTSITHNVGAKTYTGAINKANFTLRISNNVILLNPQWGLTPWSGIYDPTANR